MQKNRLTRSGIMPEGVRMTVHPGDLLERLALLRSHLRRLTAGLFEDLLGQRYLIAASAADGFGLYSAVGQHGKLRADDIVLLTGILYHRQGRGARLKVTGGAYPLFQDELTECLRQSGLSMRTEAGVNVVRLLDAARR